MCSSSSLQACSRADSAAEDGFEASFQLFGFGKLVGVGAMARWLWRVGGYSSALRLQYPVGSVTPPITRDDTIFKVPQAVAHTYENCTSCTASQVSGSVDVARCVIQQKDHVALNSVYSVRGDEEVTARQAVFCKLISYLIAQ